MSREKELLALVGEENKALLLPYVEEIVFIEGQLKELKKDNFMKSHPNNPAIKKRDKDAIRQYKEFFQQYTNAIKTISSIVGTGEEEEESPLRAWVKGRLNAETELEHIRNGKGIKDL